MNIRSIHKLVESGFHEEALKKIQIAKESGESDPILKLFEALALYDGKKDIECLSLLNDFLTEISPSHEKYNYALFTSGICLMNLGLPVEAEKLFSLVDDDYPGIEEERKQSALKVSRSNKALSISKSILEKANA